MSKKRKHKQPQAKLSPEKYIKTQARKLPVYECLINEGWQESKMCNILITRQHSNGNFTSGIYLVDLFCLGVKEAECTFNTFPEEYEDLKSKYFPEDFFQVVDYALVHNIIHAGLEFAEDYGFKPNKEFKSRAQYILEEDTDDIELIDIECGKDNKPFIVAGPDNQEESKKARIHLNNTVGPEGYFYSETRTFGNTDPDILDDFGDLDDFEDMESSEELLIDDYIYDEPETERQEDIERFKLLLNTSAEKNEDDATELFYVCKRLFYNYFGIDCIEESRETYINFLNIELNEDYIPEQLSGTTNNEHNDKIEEIIYDLVDSKELKKHKLKKLASTYPEVPFYSYIHLVEMSLYDTNDKKYKKQLDEYCSIYPNYLLLQLLKDQDSSIRKKTTNIITEDLIKVKTLKDVFNGRETIHPFEYFAFHSALFVCLSQQNDVLGMDSLIYSSNLIYPEMEEDCADKEVYAEISKVHFCEELFLK